MNSKPLKRIVSITLNQLLQILNAQYHMCMYVCDHLRAEEEPESAPVAEVLTAMAKLLRYTLTHKANEVVDWLLLINCSSVVSFYTWLNIQYIHLEGRREGKEGKRGEEKAAIENNQSKKKEEKAEADVIRDEGIRG